MDNIDNNLIISKYNELGNIWKVGDALGLKGQHVALILKKNGVKLKNPKFSEEDKLFLMENYEKYASKQQLSELSIILGRTKQFLCRKAKELGLTDMSRKYNLSKEQKEKMSKAAKDRIAKYGHPKGMLGKSHSQAFKDNMSSRMIQIWKNSPEILMTDYRKKVISDNMTKMQKEGILNRDSRCYNTKLIINDDTYNLKSNWEFNIALYLEYLKNLNLIDKWSYESKRFTFDINEFGIRSYTPDFFISKNGVNRIIELKGWYDERSKNKQMLMSRFYPNVVVELWDEDMYHFIEKEYKHKIDKWDYRLSIKNDNLCVKVVAEKFIDKDNPRVEFKIVTID